MKKTKFFVAISGSIAASQDCFASLAMTVQLFVIARFCKAKSWRSCEVIYLLRLIRRFTSRNDDTWQEIASPSARNDIYVSKDCFITSLLAKTILYKRLLQKTLFFCVMTVLLIMFNNFIISDIFVALDSSASLRQTAGMSCQSLKQVRRQGDASLLAITNE